MNRRVLIAAVVACLVAVGPVYAAVEPMFTVQHTKYVALGGATIDVTNQFSVSNINLVAGVIGDDGVIVANSNLTCTWSRAPSSQTSYCSEPGNLTQGDWFTSVLLTLNNPPTQKSQNFTLEIKFAQSGGVNGIVSPTMIPFTVYDDSSQNSTMQFFMDVGPAIYPPIDITVFGISVFTGE